METREGLSFTEDLLKEFSKATPAEYDELGDHLVDCLSRVKSFWVRDFYFCPQFFSLRSALFWLFYLSLWQDFYQVLGFRDKSEPYSDRRLVQFRDNSVSAQKILEAAPIERYIKGIASLGQENTVQKIWLEIDKLTKKRVSSKIEKVDFLKLYFSI